MVIIILLLIDKLLVNYVGIVFNIDLIGLVLMVRIKVVGMVICKFCI